MKTQEIQRIKDKVSILEGMRMVEMERWDSDLECGFVSADMNEEILRRQIEADEYVDKDYMVFAFGHFRWTYQNRVILTQRDMFQPSLPILKANHLEIGEGYKVENYNYDEQGCNRFDEINEQHFKPIYQHTKSFIVKKVSISKFGDLIIDFENGYRLEVFIDVSDPLGCWQFHEICAVNNIYVGGNGILEEDIDVKQA